MRLSAFDCAGRGISNLRGNWELVPVVFVQLVACAVLAVLGLLAGGFVAGATSLFGVDDLSDPGRLLERLEALSLNWPALAVGLSVLFIVLTVVSLVYCWFQAGIVSTLERGERQAPLGAKTSWPLFRTFSIRNLIGWSSDSAWRFFWLLGWMLLVSTVILAVFIGVAVVFTFLIQRGSAPGAMVFGCLSLLPIAAFGLTLNVWFAIGQTLATRDDGTVFSASRKALGILRRRFGAALVIALLFVFASFVSAIVFVPLTQGMTIALGDSGIAAAVVQLLLMAAQWLVSAILSIAFFGAVVALARTELAYAANGP